MTLGEAKIIVRAFIGRGDIEPALLDYFMGKGRREIETGMNFYWMNATRDFQLVIDQGTYTITSSPISLTDFKDIRALLFKDTTNPDDLEWTEVDDYDVVRLETTYAESEEGPPEAYVIKGDDIQIYPPNPDKVYYMRLQYYKWTTNPANDTSTDELLTRWPDALIYASTAHAVLALTKDEAQAKPWFDMLGRGMKKLVIYSKERGAAQRVDLIPRTGPQKWRRNLLQRWV